MQLRRRRWVAPLSAFPFHVHFSVSVWSPGNKSLRKRSSQSHFPGALFSVQRTWLVEEIRAAAFGKSGEWLQWGLDFLHPQQMPVHLWATVVNPTYKVSPFTTDLGGPVGGWNQYKLENMPKPLRLGPPNGTCWKLCAPEPLSLLGAPGREQQLPRELNNNMGLCSVPQLTLAVYALFL